MTPRCQHDVMIVNPASAPKSHICGLGAIDLISKDPVAYRVWLASQPTWKFMQGVDSFNDSKPVRRYKRVKEKFATVPAAIPERYVVDGPRVIDTFAWGYTPYVPTSYAVRSDGRTRHHIEPESVTVTVGRALADTFDSQHTLTSLDQNWRDGSPEINHDGDDIAQWEPTNSVTMNVPSSEPEIIEVSLGRKAYFEALSNEHYTPDALKVLPPNFVEKKLGIRNRNDAFVTYETLRGMREFDHHEPVQSEADEERNVRDRRIAAFIKAKVLKQPFVSPKGEGWPGAMTAAEDGVVTSRLRSLTGKQVRRHRERLQSLGIYQVPA